MWTSDCGDGFVTPTTGPHQFAGGQRPGPCQQPGTTIPGRLSAATAPSMAPNKKKRRSARAIKLQKLRSKQGQAAQKLHRATSNRVCPKPALQARAVRGSSALSAPFKIGDKRVAKTAYVGLQDPKAAQFVPPTNGFDSDSESLDSSGGVDSESDCEVGSIDEKPDPVRKAQAFTAKEMVGAHGFGYVPWDGMYVPFSQEFPYTHSHTRPEHQSPSPTAQASLWPTS